MTVKVESELRRAMCLCGVRLCYEDTDVTCKPELGDIGYIMCPSCSRNLYVVFNKKPSTQPSD